MGKVTVPNVYM